MPTTSCVQNLNPSRQKMKRNSGWEFSNWDGESTDPKTINVCKMKRTTARTIVAQCLEAKDKEEISTGAEHDLHPEHQAQARTPPRSHSGSQGPGSSVCGFPAWGFPYAIKTKALCEPHPPLHHCVKGRFTDWCGRRNSGVSVGLPRHDWHLNCPMRTEDPWVAPSNRLAAWMA